MMFYKTKNKKEKKFETKAQNRLGGYNVINVKKRQYSLILN